MVERLWKDFGVNSVISDADISDEQESQKGPFG